METQATPAEKRTEEGSESCRHFSFIPRVRWESTERAGADMPREIWAVRRSRKPNSSDLLALGGLIVQKEEEDGGDCWNWSPNFTGILVVLHDCPTSIMG